MRNEFTETFPAVRKGAHELNRDGRQVSAKRNGGIEREKEKKERGDEE
jgi:hypothetical protein